MSDLPRIKLGCRHYDRTRALITGHVRPKGFHLDVTEWSDVAAMFEAMFRGDCDVSEMSLAELVFYTSRGKADFIGIPVFPSRVFRHAFIFCNTAAGITDPRALAGKRIGFPRSVQTACIWIRGLLVEEYGISPAGTSWFVAGQHHWDENDADESPSPRDGSVFQSLPRIGDEYETIDHALLTGQIDALGTARVPPFIRARDPRGVRLFVDYPDVEAAYYRKTRLFPIMHVLVARKSVIERYPDLPRAMFDAFVQSKEAGREWLRMDPSVDIIWKNAYLEGERKIFDQDPWVYGLAENEHVLERFLAYCHDMGISAQGLTARDLFHPSTWALKEKAG